MADRSFVLLTTSRRPSGNIRAFCKDLSHTLPNIVRKNRGKLNLDGVAEKSVEFDAEKAMIVGRWKGGSGKIQLFKVSERGLKVIPPLIYVKNVKLRRDLEGDRSRRRRIKSIAITAPRESHSEVKKLGEALSDFFDVPVLPLKEVYDEEFDAAMQISTDSSNRIIIVFTLIPELVDVGPLIRTSHLVWDLQQ